MQCDPDHCDGVASLRRPNVPAAAELAGWFRHVLLTILLAIP